MHQALLGRIELNVNTTHLLHGLVAEVCNNVFWGTLLRTHICRWSIGARVSLQYHEQDRIILPFVQESAYDSRQVYHKRGDTAPESSKGHEMWLDGTPVGSNQSTVFRNPRGVVVQCVRSRCAGASEGLGEPSRLKTPCDIFGARSLPSNSRLYVALGIICISHPYPGSAASYPQSSQYLINIRIFLSFLVSEETYLRCFHWECRLP